MTPVFSAFQSLFSEPCRALRAATAGSLNQFQALFGSWLPPGCLAQADEGPHSRQRQWPLRLVFWTFCWQIAQAGSSCREAIRQAQALCLASGQPIPPDETSPYCQARGALPLERLDEMHRGVVGEAERALGQGDLWQGCRVLVADGTTVTAPDTRDNQKRFPQQSVQAPGCGFPILRIAALMSLATGMIVQWSVGPWRSSELGLLQNFWDVFKAGDVLLGDRLFCTWGLLAQCLRREVQAVFRVRGKVRRDFRRGRRLSKVERLVTWSKPKQRPRTIGRREWNNLPDQLTLRLVRCVLEVPGFRTRRIILATTLLDRDRFPPAALSRLYRRRWTMELTLRNLKITLQMDHLSCQNPENLEREIRLHFLVHNLIRRLMLEAARRHHVQLDRISFAGSLAVARRYGEALLQARSKKQRTQLFAELLRVIAFDLVPERPGRREPRAVKRRPKPYPRLMCHRRRFREISHQNRYYLNSAFGPRYRKSSKA
jgi:hypothetical protein